MEEDTASHAESFKYKFCIRSPPNDAPKVSSICVQHRLSHPSGWISHLINIDGIRALAPLRSHSFVSSQDTQQEMTAAIEPKHINFSINCYRADTGKDTANEKSHTRTSRTCDRGLQMQGASWRFHRRKERP